MLKTSILSITLLGMSLNEFSKGTSKSLATLYLTANPQIDPVLSSASPNQCNSLLKSTQAGDGTSMGDTFSAYGDYLVENEQRGLSKNGCPLLYPNKELS